MSRIRALKHPHLSCALLGHLLLFATLTQSAESASFLSLFRAIDERLGYMEDVALFKAQNQIPIEDRARERIVLADAKAFAASQGLNAQTTEQFFNAQIIAAKAIQYRYRAELLTLGVAQRSVDLQGSIRPKLDRLGSEITRLFGELLRQHGALEETHRDLFKDGINSRLLNEPEKHALFNAMLQVRLEK
ncbi:MAG: gamma subclass chorismate mutase AroQ [Pseudohongiellaceae bacterium]